MGLDPKITCIFFEGKDFSRYGISYYEVLKSLLNSGIEGIFELYNNPLLKIFAPDDLSKIMKKIILRTSTKEDLDNSKELAQEFYLFPSANFFLYASTLSLLLSQSVLKQNIQGFFPADKVISKGNLQCSHSFPTFLIFPFGGKE